jgi:large subunit ribosomal protein L23
MRELRSIVRRPIISEKGTRLRAAGNCYLFIVDRRANKIEIAQAIETIFKVNVTNVRTINCKGKPKTLGRSSGYRPDWKKAIVTLKSGDAVEIFDEV